MPAAHPGKPPVVLLDNNPASSAAFAEALQGIGSITQFCAGMDEFAGLLTTKPDAVGLVDVDVLRRAPAATLEALNQLREKHRVGLMAGCEMSGYVPHLRKWGILHVVIKSPPPSVRDLQHALNMLRDPTSGIGLMSHLNETVRMFVHPVRTRAEKLAAIESVINHFATHGFEIHELYNVRLILEEMTNNALFHSFRGENGEPKYTYRTLVALAENESVSIEYGSDSNIVGFAVTDSAGTLDVETLLVKLERQLGEQGVLDESGRGIYLSYLLSSRFVVNIEPGKSTQIVALFQQSMPPNARKSFFVNEIARG